ncbi:hypothetical protein HAX54_036645 [Datura stramonium]|uniref:CCHC-type domain-containing protein n=1 Tax=Datura stramonium TaxID=4076 RepID=A0ABS8VL58_DATST|nr:hypothetical protein [Datura stramonium]
MDACTSATLRGRYARLCVQVPLDEPVTVSIQIENHKQSIIYEGEGYLCTICGRLGHTSSSCPSQQHNKTKISSVPNPKLQKEEEWQIVKFKRRQAYSNKKQEKEDLPLSKSSAKGSKINNMSAEQGISSTSSPTPLLSSHEQHTSNSTTHCSAPSSLRDPTNPSSPLTSVLGGDGATRACSHTFHGNQWCGDNNNSSKFKLSSSTNNRRDEVGFGELCQPYVDDKCPGSSSAGSFSYSLLPNANLVESPTPLQPSIEHEQQCESSSFL